MTCERNAKAILIERQMLEVWELDITCDFCGEELSRPYLFVCDTIVPANALGDFADRPLKPNRVLCFDCAGDVPEPESEGGDDDPDDLDELVAQVHAATKDDPEAVSYLKQRLETAQGEVNRLDEENETLRARIEGMERDRAALRARISGLTRVEKN